MITVTAAVIVHDNKILIAKRSSTDKLAHKWEFPGGKIEQGESPEECLQRELHEELGITTSIGQFLDDTVHHYDHITVRLLFYRVDWLNGDIVPTVHDNVVFVSIDAMKQYDFADADIPFVTKIRSGQIEL